MGFPTPPPQMKLRSKSPLNISASILRKKRKAAVLMSLQILVKYSCSLIVKIYLVHEVLSKTRCIQVL